MIDRVGMGVSELDADCRDGFGECEEESNVELSSTWVAVLPDGASL